MARVTLVVSLVSSLVWAASLALNKTLCSPQKDMSDARRGCRGAAFLAWLVSTVVFIVSTAMLSFQTQPLPIASIIVLVASYFALPKLAFALLGAPWRAPELMPWWMPV